MQCSQNLLGASFRVSLCANKRRWPFQRDNSTRHHQRQRQTQPIFKTKRSSIPTRQFQEHAVVGKSRFSLTLHHPACWPDLEVFWMMPSTWWSDYVGEWCCSEELGTFQKAFSYVIVRRSIVLFLGPNFPFLHHWKQCFSKEYLMLSVKKCSLCKCGVQNFLMVWIKINKWH